MDKQGNHRPVLDQPPPNGSAAKLDAEIDLAAIKAKRLAFVKALARQAARRDAEEGLARHAQRN